MQKNSEILKKALETVEEMMEDRNYIPLNHDITKTDVFERFKDRKYITPSNKFAVVLIVNSTSQIKNFSSIIDNDDYETILFIYMNTLTVQHKSIEKNLNYKIEIWSVYNLLTNISKHIFQPKIELLVTDCKLNYKLPKISFYDPIIRYYKFKKGDTIKITDKDNFISYRLIV